jgi:parallel beta-helix repeat protein
LFRKNHEHLGMSCGFFFTDLASATCEGNDVAENEGTGVEIEAGSDPIFTHNTVHENAAKGIVVWKGGAGTVKHNEVYANALTAILVDGDCPKAVVDSNTVKESNLHAMARNRTGSQIPVTSSN